MKNNHLQNLEPFGLGANMTLKLLNRRLGNTDLPKYYKDTVDNANHMAMGLAARGGFPQQERMIRDKRKSLDKATLYSYQAALIRKCIPDDVDLMEGDKNLPVRALINPDKNKFDYDNKILSVGFEHGFHPGDVFEWCRTNSYWLITLQDLDEIAYFRGEIRRCDYQIEWLDDGQKKKTFASIRGPVETKINYIQKHGISVDTPNYSLHILLPKTEDNMKQFQRYSKFYLGDAMNPDDQICWRVEATDSISTVGILEITAVEYYANETTDDIENGLVDAFVKKIEDPNPEPHTVIGETFIKPKKEYYYYINDNVYGEWYLGQNNVPVQLTIKDTEEGYPGVIVKWNSGYSGQFDLWYGDKNGPLFDYQKTIVVESLF